MKKLGYLLVAGTMLCALPGGAVASRARTASGEYNTLVLSTEPAPAAQGRFSNGVTFKVRPGERFVGLVIADQNADHVRGVVSQDLDGDGVDDTTIEICDATTTPIKINPAFDVKVWTQEGTCEDGTLSTPTVGKITATFTR